MEPDFQSFLTKFHDFLVIDSEVISGEFSQTVFISGPSCIISQVHLFDTFRAWCDKHMIGSRLAQKFYGNGKHSRLIFAAPILETLTKLYP